MIDALNRCVLGIRPPDSAKAAMVEAQLQLRRRAGADLVRWTPASEMVLPMAILGEITPEHIVRIHNLVSPIIHAHKPATLTINGFGGHPTNLQPRWLWAGIEGEIEPMAALNMNLEHALTPLLPDHESRGFRPQIAMGRLKQESEANRSALGRAVRVAGIGNLGSFEVTQIELMRYQATDSGPYLATIEAYLLRG